MLVYELYFSEHMKALDVDVFRFITNDKFAPIDSVENRAKHIGGIYNWLQEKENPINQEINHPRQNRLKRKLNLLLRKNLRPLQRKHIH